ncbi:condensation domain-containing protein [Flavobacterium sp. '19STA2R22 D10 B1']|uniref:condensation domain-containing protein n=1 Tax=Flavobacterium aerium TaxID=3037261 RepID=UPI00278C77D6|nr:condensation domain-containing protein [Flavobacterium sp. '19STA2R22 D10 B1']
MTIEEVLKELRSKNIRITLVNDNELDVKAPKGVVNQEIILLLKEKKQAIIKYLNDFKKNEDSIQKAAFSNVGYPLSFAQKKLWVLSQLEERSIAYIVSDVMIIPAKVDVELLEKAIHSTIIRHESLRTIFRKDENDELRQWILPETIINFKLEYKDLRNAGNKEEYVNDYILKDKNKVFNLSEDILLRTCLFQLEDNSFIFHYMMHHIITDGVSMKIMKDDVLEYYEAFIMDRKPSLSELRIQYKDYTLWQYEQLKTKEFQEHKKFWLNELSGKLPILELPNQKPRPKVMTYNGCTLSTYIYSETTNKFKEFCLHNKGTMFSGILTVWKILFYKYTNTKDLIIGSPIAGRDITDLENQIGIYMNMKIHRNKLDVEDNFIETYVKIKNSTLASTKHQMYPVDKLMDDLKLTYDPSRNPIYDVMLSYHNTDENENLHLKLTREEIDVINVDDLENSKLDMLINVKEEGEYLYFDINYNTDIYEEAMIRKLMSDFKRILNELLNNPSEKIKNIDYNSEIKKTIKEKNKTRFNMKIK